VSNLEAEAYIWPNELLLLTHYIVLTELLHVSFS